MIVQQTRFADLQRGSSKEAGAETLSWVEVVEEGRGQTEQDPLFDCVLLELPDRSNRHNVSRIPDGRYAIERLDRSPAFDYPHLWVHDEGETDAAGRAGIKWHIANFARQLEGCGAPGEEFVDLDGDGLLDVTRSEATLDRLLRVLPARADLHIESREWDEVETAEVEPLGVSSMASLLQSVSPK